MEDFIQIIIWLFIIISFLSGLFKKRDKSAPPPVRKQQRPDFQVSRKPSPTYSQSNEQYDILREIEGLFKSDAPAQTSSGKTTIAGTGETSTTSSEHISTEGIRKESEYTSYEREKSKRETTRELSYRTKTEHDLTSSEHVYSTYQTKKKPKVDQKIAEQALKFEKMLAEKKREPKIFYDFRRKIAHPETLKEYILFSEIIGKPKALRR